jgi:hypothetical protein
MKNPQLYLETHALYLTTESSHPIPKALSPEPYTTGPTLDTEP